MTHFKSEFHLKETKFENEKDFIRMMLLLLNELKKIHSKNILHRDIKCDNIMFYEKSCQIYFVFIDFGSSFDFSNKEQQRIKIKSQFYSPPEQNDFQKECFASK